MSDVAPSQSWKPFLLEQNNDTNGLFFNLNGSDEEQDFGKYHIIFLIYFDPSKYTTKEVEDWLTRLARAKIPKVYDDEDKSCEYYGISNWCGICETDTYKYFSSSIIWNLILYMMTIPDDADLSTYEPDLPDYSFKTKEILEKLGTLEEFKEHLKEYWEHDKEHLAELLAKLV